MHRALPLEPVRVLAMTVLFTPSAELLPDYVAAPERGWSPSAHSLVTVGAFSQQCEDEVRRAVTILHVGGVNLDLNRDPFDVDRHVTLAPFDLLPGIIACRAAALRRLHGLTVDCGPRRICCASRQISCLPAQRIQHAIEDTAVAPSVEVILNCRKRRKTLGKCPPLAARRQHVLDRVEDLPQIRRSRTSPW